MMAEAGVVSRYARALFEAAQSQGTVEQVGSDLEGIASIFKESPDLLRVLRAPVIPAERKAQLVRTAFGPRVSDLTLRFLEMVVQKRREEVLPEVPAEFQHLAYAMLNVLPVEVTTAVPLTPEERTALAASLGRRTGKRIRLVEKIEPELMGGMVLRLGDTIIDGSVQGQLQRLRQRLLAGAGESQVVQSA
jgi:F-type H+-transporting ATPase subunit delta